MRTIEQILRAARTVAVVGLSNKPGRASLEVAGYLQQQGYRIIPINPAYAGQPILGYRPARIGAPFLSIDLII